MAQSLSYNYTTSRDAIITRALRIVGAIGQGETPSSTAVTEAAEALNDLVKEWETDGMPLWAVTNSSLTPIAGTAAYTVGIGLTTNIPAPLKIIQAWGRVTASGLDTPILVITRQEYTMLGNKTSSGAVSQLWYNPPGGIAATESVGTITLYPTPDTNYATYNTVNFNYQRPFMDFDSSTDVPDFPQYWYNAVKWGLADQLAYEYGVGLSERAMISKKAQFHKDNALSFGTEEGSLKLQPMPSWNWESY
jgi:hypothetical protein